MLKAWKVGIALLTFLLTGASRADDILQGKLALSGSIFSPTCNIDSESRDQTVDFGQLAARPEDSTSRVASSQTAFTLRLVNCDLQLLKNQSVDVLLTGIPSQYDPRMLAVDGDAKGIAIEIADSRHRIIPPGIAVNVATLIAGDNELTFNTSLHIFGKRVGAGEFNSTAQILLRYF
ncbi:fimbrial protein [Cedecea sp.]|jgi:type 1 fimbria pilin|uniref:fimbrial protein n=1 Tax=Cedecea sp. TaxID=1970739 RepID=UPI0012AD53B2|nr:fimbrial protein [Enterobacteriaceae bacterium RIT693]